MPIATAAIAGGAISGIGSLVGGLFSSNAASAASKAQVSEEQQALALQQQQSKQTQQQLTPYYNAGTNALANLQYALGTTNGVPGAGTNQTPLSAYLAQGGSTSLGNGYTLVPGANGTYNIIDKNGSMHWQGVTANTPISDLQASVGDPNVQATSNSQGVSPAIQQNIPNGYLTQPYNGGQPFQFTPGQSGLTGTGLSTPVAPGQQPAYGQAGFGSPTVNQNGTLQAPGAFSYAAYQAPAPFTAAPFTFGQNQTGIPTAGSAQAGSLPPNSGVGTAGVGANGIATYNAPDPFNYTAANFQASPGYAYALQQAQMATQNAAAAAGGGFSGNMLRALQTNAVGLADQDFNSQEALAQQAYGLNSTNSQNAFPQNYNSALQGYDTNYNSQLGAYTTNSNIAQQAYNTNFGNALNTYDTNLNAGTSIYQQNFGNANTTFQQGLANQLSQQQQIYNMLNGLSGTGQNAAVQQGGFGAASTNQQASLLGQIGTSTAAGQIGQAQALNSGLTGAGNALTGGLQTNALLQLLQAPQANAAFTSSAASSPLNTGTAGNIQLSAYPNLSDPQYAYNVSQQTYTGQGY